MPTSESGSPQPRDGARPGAIIVGVELGQNPHVVTTAVKLAELAGAPLIAAHAVETPVGAQIGFMEVAAVDPSIYDDLAQRETEFPEDLMQVVLNAVPTDRIEIEFKVLSGDPGPALAWLSNQLNAAYVVVGAKRKGLAAVIKQIAHGNVVVDLAHRQPAPVVVVPWVKHESGSPTDAPQQPSQG